jgi:hypothetical protein
MRVLLLFILVTTSLSIKLINNGGSGCTASSKCGKCTGDCDSDNDCAAGLKCFQRDKSSELVPGCEPGSPANDVADYDYCYEPCPSGTSASAGCTGQLSAVLANGSPSCGISDGALEIWVNTAIASNEVYDMQSGDFTSAGTITGAAAQINGIMRANNGVIDGSLSIGSLSGKVIRAANIADNTITAANIAADAVTPASLQNSGHFTMGRVKADYINAGNPAWHSSWRVNLDQNVWIHHMLEVDGVARFDSIANFRGTGSSSMVRKVIWGYGSGGIAVDHAGDIGYAYVYGFDNSHSQSSVAADFDGYIIAKLGVMTRSDRRIKQNIVDVSDISSLNRVLKIPVRNYQYKNQLKRGYGNITGFIAQEIKEVFPEAVTLQTMGIPYIGATFKIFEMNNKIITVATPKEANATLMVGDKLNAYIHRPDDDENSHTRYRELEVLTVGESKTTLKCDECEEDESANAIYIYEKIVDDFHVIDKDRIFTLHHGAIQELHKEQETLKQKVLNLENTIAQLTQRLAALEAK